MSEPTMNAIMPPLKLTQAVLVVQAPDGRNEEIDFGLLNRSAADQVCALLNRLGIRAQVDMRDISIVKKY